MSERRPRAAPASLRRAPRAPSARPTPASARASVGTPRTALASLRCRGRRDALACSAAAILTLLSLPTAGAARSAAWQEPAPAPAAPALRLAGAAVRVVVDAGASGTRVVARYRMEAAPGVASIHLRALAFQGAVPTAVHAEAGGMRVPVELDGTAAPRLAGSLALPPSLRGGGPFELVLEYGLDRAVERDGRFDVAVPLLLPDAQPDGAPDGFFTAEAVLPSAYNVAESFPTVRRTIEAEGDAMRHTLSLQVAPSLLRLRGGVGRAAGLGFGRSVDLATIAVILALSVLGWRRMVASTAQPGVAEHSPAGHPSPESSP